MSTEELITSAVRALGGPVFAVLDGAKIPDLGSKLQSCDLEGRQLYRGESLPIDVAPLLVGPIGDRVDAIAGLLDEVGMPASAVFWLCAAGENALFRHLRGLNMALLDGEAIMFRHADANVMAQVVPALGVDLLSRLLGPAEAIFFVPDADYAELDQGSPIKLLCRRAEWPKALSGILEIDNASLVSISDQRLLAFRRKRVRLLKETCPALFEGMSAKAIGEWSKRHEESGKALGLKTERGLFQWSYLMGRSNGSFIAHRDIRDHLASGNPDERLDELMRTMVQASRPAAA